MILGKQGRVILILPLLIVSRMLAEVPPAERFAGQIRESKDSVAWLQEYQGNMKDRMQQAPSFGKMDDAVITAGIHEEIAAWNNARTAWEKGDEPGAVALVRLARDIGGRRGAWERRLDWRYRQGNEAPGEDTYEGISTYRPAFAVAVYMEAKKRLSEACGRVAEAYVPDVNPQLIFKLEDEVFAAQLEVEVAEMKMTWAAEDRSYAMRDAVASPEFTAAQQRLDEHRQQRENMFRQYRKQQREVERFDRSNTALINERDKQAELARQARDRAVKK